MAAAQVVKNFQFFAFFLSCFTIYYDFVHLVLPTRVKFGGRLKYLTVWSMSVQPLPGFDIRLGHGSGMELRKIFHLFTFILQSYAIYYNVMYITYDGKWNFLNCEGYPGKFKYLTIWNKILQAVFFGLCVLNNIFGSNHGPNDPRPRSGLQKTVDRFYACIAWPLGIFVAVTFWGLYAINRDLVYPEILDKYIPRWMNHLMHTAPLPLLLIENYLVHHEYPRRKNGVPGTMLLALIYIIWIHVIAHVTGHWVYPILAVLGTLERSGFIAALLTLFGLLYISGEKIHQRTWGFTKSVKTQ